MPLKRHIRRLYGTLTLVVVSAVTTAANGNDFDRIMLLKIIPKGLITYWYRPPSLDTLPNDRFGNEIRYGREIFVNTARYLGPNGSVGSYLGNHMNCQNCHLEAGTRLFGGSLATTHGNYPQWRPREDIIIALGDRINLCIERPHSGRHLGHETREMRALLAYIKWLGTDLPLNSRQFGDEIMELPLLSRAADPVKGRAVYDQHCQQCHGADGQGQKAEDGIAYTFPPLWGPDSYGIGSSMNRIRKAAGFIKNNMPFGTTWENPVLTDEEAYDVAAFVNDDRIHPRTQFDISHDYPDLREKPIDYPYGPYADNFSEEQHKFGPFKPILDARKRMF